MHNGKIVVKFKKIERHGQIKDQITEVHAFRKSELPKEYFTDGAYVYMKLSKAKVPMLVTPMHTYVVGDALTSKQVNEMLKMLESAGDRFHYINGSRKLQHAKDVAARKNLVGKEWVKVI